MGRRRSALVSVGLALVLLVIIRMSPAPIPLKLNRILAVVRASSRDGSLRHVKETYDTIGKFLPSADRLVFTGVKDAKNGTPAVPHSVIGRGKKWYNLVRGRNIPQYHGDSWDRIEWRTGNCYDFVKITSIIGQDRLAQYDLFLWVEDDVLLSREFANYLEFRNTERKWDVLVGLHIKAPADHSYPGGGFLAVAFKPDALRGFVRLVKKEWTENPIDWILDHLQAEAKIWTVGPVVTHRKLPSTLTGCKHASAQCI